MGRRGQQPVVRLMVVAHWGGGSGTWQGTVRVAHDGAGDELLSMGWVHVEGWLLVETG